MINLLVAIMVLWSLCLLVAATASFCETPLVAKKWFDESAIFAFMSIWLILIGYGIATCVAQDAETKSGAGVVEKEVKP